MFKRYLYIALYLLSPIIPVISIYLSNLHKYNNIMIVLPSMLGAIAYSWIIGQFVMASRPNFIMQYFWDDEYYGFHKIMGILILIVALLHGLFEIRLGRIFLSISIIGYAGIASLAIFIVIASVFMIDENSLKRNFKKNLERHKIFEYENLVKIHSILAVVAMLLLSHVLISSVGYAVKLVYVIYFSIACISYGIFKIKKIINKVNVTD